MRLLLCSVLLSSLACRTTPAPEDGVGDAAILDAASPDAASPDAAIPDATSPDATTPDASADDLSSIYYVVRHAERDVGEDPPINEEGERRSAALAALLADRGVDEIVVTFFLRNQQTAAPLAAQTGAPIVEAPPRMTAAWPDFGAAVAAWQLGRERPGTTTVMIGHSGGYNNQLLRALGVEETIRERYQDLVIVTRRAGQPTTWEITEYGGPSSLDP
ncbi:MAG: histidine phosphatase family protein [Myxococcales bacterium]|nr:histidine phosphatase family protein [Myxococcales bacterium]